MELSADHLYALNVAADYARLKRYLGILPKSMAMHLKKKRLDELVKEGYLDKLKVVIGDDVSLKGYKITLLGLSAILDDRSEPKDEDALSLDALDALNDIYHFGQLSENKGIAPKKTMPRHNQRVIDALCERGFVYRVKIRWSDGKKFKGYLVSPRGELELRNTGRI